MKDAPKGTKLYSPYCGGCRFEEIIEDWEGRNTIRVLGDDGGLYHFCEDGSLRKGGECFLFPSKYNRSWSTFKLDLKYKRGDFVYYINYVDEAWISIHKKFNGDGNINTFVDFNCNTGKVYFGEYCDDGLECGTLLALVHEARHATEEEKQKLLKAIDEKGYVWDEEKLELRKKVDEIEQLGDTGHTIDKNTALKVGYSCFLQSPFGLCLSTESEEYKKKMQEFEKNLEEGNIKL